jgi:hypothetical protein
MGPGTVRYTVYVDGSMAIHDARLTTLHCDARTPYDMIRIDQGEECTSRACTALGALSKHTKNNKIKNIEYN